MQGEGTLPSVHVFCTFDPPADQARMQQLGERLRTFFQDQDGYVRFSEGAAFNWSAGPTTSAAYSSAWASNADADAAKARADAWCVSTTAQPGGVHCIFTRTSERATI